MSCGTMVRHQVSLSGSGPNSVQKVDNVIPHMINLYPLDGDLSSGRRYQMLVIYPHIGFLMRDWKPVLCTFLVVL